MSILNLSRDLPFADITGFQVKFSDPVNITGTGLSLTSTAGGPTYAPRTSSARASPPMMRPGTSPPRSASTA